MPRWIIYNSPEECPASERKVAEFLQGLEDSFTVRWGFFYTDPYSNLSREGDFVIQGPDGHVLVMEAKGGHPAPNPATGEWNTADKENPFLQLDREWKGAMERLRNQADQIGAKMPYVDRVLALPDVNLSPEQVSYEGTARDRVAGAGDLGDFKGWWRSRFHGRHLECSRDQAKRIFDGVFAIGMPAGATRHVLDFADKVIEHHTRGHFEILDALAGNDQLIFSGGPGTGKSWLALEQASRWAAAGRKVLFLCYNLELEAWHRAVCAKKHEGITVRSYQSLGAELLGHPDSGRFASREEESRYYDRELPGALAAKVAETGFERPYDALVVDEAQDHNTEPPIDGHASGPGWWTIYLGLLKMGGEAPVAIFHDQAQRLSLRAGSFNPESLRNSLMQPVSVRVSYPLRYTRQLRSYFRTLEGDHSGDLLRDMHHSRVILPEGPEPELISDVSEKDEGMRCAEIVKRWIREGLAKPHEIMVLYPSSSAVPSWLEQGKINGVSFQTGAGNLPKEMIRAVSINKAKGLERRGVVVVGLPDWSEASRNEYKAKTFIQGVTRAQQLLAVITRTPTASTG
jgi:hypothetical protein